MVKSIGCRIWGEDLVRIWLKFCDFKQFTNLL